MSNRSSEDNELDQLCEEFETHWATGERPRIEAFLKRGEANHQEDLLAQLLQIELWWRRDESPPPTTEQYKQRFPGLTSAVEEAIRQFNARTQANADAQVESPVTTPPDGNDATEQLTPQRNRPRRPSVPKTIGPYKILQPIGEGGMGQVFMAEQQEPVKRRVALKIISTETPTDKILARFEAERQALAMMDHQNIAKVLDAGVTDDGRPYFAMELVKGIPITEYCDKNRLTPNERLELFVQTCRAIQHAHQRGIIHRDLKPSNVLVTLYDGKPVAKVIDFGLAKAMHEQILLTNKTLFTEYGQVVGTLEYMSPEQAELNALDIDTRTDVYSLGVILFELLTGSTPIGRERLRSEAFDRILAIIREEEVQRPSTRFSDSGDAISGISEQRKTDPRKLGMILKGDLDWVALKTLEKDRTRRYDGASALADDIERYLRYEPLEACPPSVVYRLKKAYRKHKSGFLVSAVLMALLVGGLVGTGTMWRRAKVAENKVAVLESRLYASGGLLDGQIRRGNSEREVVYDSLGAPETDLLQRSRFVGLDSNQLVKELESYEEILAQWRKFHQADDREVADSLYRVAEGSRLVGDFQRSKSSYTSAIEMFDRLQSENIGDPYFLVMLGMSHASLGALYQAASRMADAEQSYQRALQVLEGCESEYPTYSQAQIELARTNEKYGILLLESYRRTDARNRFANSENTLRTLLRHHPENIVCRRQLANTLCNTGRLSRAIGEYDTAETHYREAIAVYDRMFESDQTNTRDQFLSATTKMNLGYLLAVDSRLDAGEQCLIEATRQFEGLPEDNPEYRFNLAKCLLNVCFIHGMRFSTTNEDSALNAARSNALAARRVLSFLHDAYRNERFRDVAEIDSWMGIAAGNLGAISDAEGDYNSFANHLQEAIMFQREAMEKTPQISAYRTRLMNHHYFLARTVLVNYLDEESDSRLLVAFQNLRAAVDLGLKTDFINDPIYEPLRTDARFESLHRSIEPMPTP